MNSAMPTHAAILGKLERRYTKPVPQPLNGTRAKYIIVDKMGVELAVLIHDSISHSDAINTKDCPPVSAGFYWINTDGSISIDLRRGSTSLNLSPRPQDADIIADTMHLMGLHFFISPVS